MSKTPEINYLRWLMDDVNLDWEQYRLVCNQMLYFPFDDSFGNDMNRTYDAVALREEFEEDYDVEVNIFDDHSCGMLEMMVGLARRAADIMYDAHGDDQTPHYFDVMFKNLGLDKYQYGDFNPKEIDAILERCSSRHYGRGGIGCLWSVKHPPEALKDVEIWSQMNWYLTEKWFEMGKKV